MKKSECGLRIRVDDRLRRDFIAACKDKDQTAAQVIRSFMRRVVETNPSAMQEDLFLNENEL
jgi:hypothetical protein